MSWPALFQGGKNRSFPNFFANPFVFEQNLDNWEFGKGALSANVNFFGNHSWGLERVQTQFWVECGGNARIVEKIWLSGEERLFRRLKKSSQLK